MRAAQVSAAVLVGWANKSSQFGVNAGDALAIAGIMDGGRSCEQTRIPLASFTSMAEYIGDHSRNKAASWLIGEGYDLAELGEIGEAILSAQTLGGALRRFAANFELLQDSSRLTFEVSGETAIMSYRILDPAIWPRNHDALFSLGIMAKIIKLAVPDALDHAELGFECGRRETGLNLAQSQLTFECEANSIRIPAAMMDAPMPVAPAMSASDLKILAEWLISRRHHLTARERLTENIFARLFDDELNQEQLAREIGMSSRTMRRRLADEATSFQRLLDECRMRQAVLEFRIRPCASISDIALRLGYAEHSTFTRAFTRWAGVPPQRFRTGMRAIKD